MKSESGLWNRPEFRIRICEKDGSNAGTGGYMTKEEFQKLTEKYHAIRFIASGSQHDFDRNTDSAQTKELLKETITFLHTLI